MIFNDAKLRELFTRKGRTYPAESVIFLEQEGGDEMYVIVSGEVEISKTYREQEIFGGSRLKLGSVAESLATLKAGDFFGEMALLNDEPRMATARALTVVEVIVLKTADLEALMHRSPDLAVQILRSVCRRLRDVSETPRLQFILPELQKLLQSIQLTGRSRKAEETKPVEEVKKPVAAAAPEAEAAPADTPAPKKKKKMIDVLQNARQAAGAGKTEAPAPPPAPAAPPPEYAPRGAQPAAAPVATARPGQVCPQCARLCRADDNYCSRCGGKLPAAGNQEGA